MGRARDRRAASAAEEALRRGCGEVLRLKQKGDTDRAILLAIKLADQYPKSASPCNLVGFLIESKAATTQEKIDKLPAPDPRRVRHGHADADAARIAEDRARCRYAEDMAAIVSHLASYHEGCALWYGKAAHLAPRCPYTRANYARMLEMSDQTAQAYREYNFALKIRHPECPENNNPWMSSTDLVPDDKKKASAILMARNEFSRFLYHSDAQVFTACCELLLNLRTGKGTPGVTAKKTAKDLAARYPFSARANLLGPFLTRLLAETSSTSSMSKLTQHEKVLREIEDCVDMFPSSVVICLFKAEVLFTLGRYLEASLQCLRGLKITMPDDPVSQDIPPGSASGSGRAGRTGNIMNKLIDLLEQSQEKVVDAEEIEKLLQALRLTPDDDDAECRVKGLVEDLNRKLLEDCSRKSKTAAPDLSEQKGPFSKEHSKEVLTEMPKGLCKKDKNIDAVKGSLSKEQPTKQAQAEKPMLSIDPGKGDVDKEKSVITIPQFVLYSNTNKKFTKKKSDEAVRPLQIVENMIVPRVTVDLYAEYCQLRSLCSVKEEICHLCIFEDEAYYHNGIPKGNMMHHCIKEHKDKGSTVKCDLNTCGVRLRREEDNELHHYYCHVLDTDWWLKW